MHKHEKFNLEVDLDDIKNIMKEDALNRIFPFILHDLNNKLAAISGYTELMMIDGQNGDNKRSDLVKTLGITDEAIKIIATLKDITGNNNGFQANKVFWFNGVLESITTLMSRVFVKNKNSVKRNPAISDVQVNGDKYEFMYAVIVILIELVEKIGESGSIEIDTECSGGGCVDITISGTKNNTENNGMGLGKGVLSEKMTLLFLDKVLEGMGGCFEILQNNKEIIEYKLTLKTTQMPKNKTFFSDLKVKLNSFETFNMV